MCPHHNTSATLARLMAARPLIAAHIHVNAEITYDCTFYCRRIVMFSVRSAMAGLLLASSPVALADTMAVGPAEVPLVAVGWVAAGPVGGPAVDAGSMLAPMADGDAAAVPVAAAVAPAEMVPEEPRPVFNLSGGSDMVRPRAPATICTAQRRSATPPAHPHSTQCGSTVRSRNPVRRPVPQGEAITLMATL